MRVPVVSSAPVATKTACCYEEHRTRTKQGKENKYAKSKKNQKNTKVKENNED